jgi:hypothetical protein
MHRPCSSCHFWSERTLSGNRGKDANVMDKYQESIRNSYLNVVCSIEISQANFRWFWWHKMILQSLHSEKRPSNLSSRRDNTIYWNNSEFSLIKKLFPEFRIWFIHEKPFWDMIQARDVSMSLTAGFLHEYSPQYRDFIIIFWCLKQRRSSFLQNMLIDPDSNITRENDLHMPNRHSSMTPDRPELFMTPTNAAIPRSG